MKKYALLSVYDKEGIVVFAKELVSLGYELISTGGTAKVLGENSVPFVPIQDITGNPESFDGRMKTISFQIESGLLFDQSNAEHVKQAKELGIKRIDIVACNLYPFEHTINKEGVTYKEAIEQIDVGGPTMVRAAAKGERIVVVDPKDYGRIIHTIKALEPDARLRLELQTKAFAHLSFYDSQIAAYFRAQLAKQAGTDTHIIPQEDIQKIFFPEEITIPGRKLLDLRYGENPHQQGAVYTRPGFHSSLENLERKWGRELSLINITDINAGLESVRLFSEPAAVVIKHNSPSGIGLGENPQEALKRAIEADPESAFGGIIVLNENLTLETAKVIGEFKDERRGNIDIVAVPSIDSEALEFLQRVRKTMGIYTFGKIPSQLDPLNIKWIDGGFIVQTADTDVEKGFEQWKVVTEKTPTPEQMKQMEIAWKFVSRIKSNSVIVVDGKLPMTRGIGSGQTSRVRSTKLAIEQAGEYTKGGILASDSFFPFSDSVEAAAKVGITAIIQQGGSIRDQDSIDAANKAGIVMVFTGRRAFWH